MLVRLNIKISAIIETKDIKFDMKFALYTYMNFGYLFHLQRGP